MSIIVAVKKDGKAVIAADMMYSFGGTNVNSKYLRNQSKIYQIEKSFIGTVGATAHENVLQHLFETHKNMFSFGSKREIFDSYLKIHPILKEQYFLKTEESDNDEYESSQIDGLIINRKGIFGIYSWREVYEFEKFWAIGSGQSYALGAMYSVYDSIDAPEEIAEIAVNAACEFDDGCGLPMMIHSIKLSKSVLE